MEQIARMHGANVKLSVLRN